MNVDRRRLLYLAGAALAAPSPAWSQSYPVRPVHMVVGFAAGGGADIMARLIGQALSERLGQQIVVDNRPGAGTNISAEAVVRAAPGEGDTAMPFSAPPEREDNERRIDSRQPDAISSLCGLPAITVPCGFSRAKLPLGIQFLGRALNDHAVIAAANLLQAHTDWHTKRPPIA
jgi:hypothetical protein